MARQRFRLAQDARASHGTSGLILCERRNGPKHCAQFCAHPSSISVSIGSEGLRERLDESPNKRRRIVR
jgi:hypothetical protein